jgi:mRNA interferase MazF
MSLFQQGGVYLVRLDPAKGVEIGKLRPVVVLTNPHLLNTKPPLVFVCPLSSQSQPEFSALHIPIAARERLQKDSFALVEHCRSLSASRLQDDLLATLSSVQLNKIVHTLGIMIEP